MTKNTVKYARRTTEDTIYVQYLLNIGFSKSLIAHALLNEHDKPFGLRSIGRTEKLMKKPLAFQRHKWPTRPSAKIPGNLLTSHDNRLEFSLYGSALFYLYGERIYEQLSINEIIEAYDLYTNTRYKHSPIQQITPDTAYWVVRELTSHSATLVFCNHCSLYYYSSVNQPIADACPFESNHPMQAHPTRRPAI